MGLRDTVSYKGDCYVMECAEPDGDWPPNRVFLRSPVSPANAKWVAWSAVRPLVIDREPLLLPRSYPTMNPMTLSVDDVLVYSESCDDPSVIRLGYVMSVTATHAVVQKVGVLIRRATDAISPEIIGIVKESMIF